MKIADEIRQLWTRVQELRRALDLDASEFFLNPGASEREIAAEERRLGFPFPEQLRLSYAVHRETLDPPFKICMFLSWGSMRDRLNSSNEWLEQRLPIKTGPGIKPPRFSPQLIPFGFSCETYYCVDLDPDQGGQVGQIVAVNLQRRTAKVVASDLIDLLRQGVAFLEKELARQTRSKKKKAPNHEVDDVPPELILGSVEDVARMLNDPKAYHAKLMAHFEQKRARENGPVTEGEKILRDAADAFTNPEAYRTKLMAMQAEYLDKMQQELLAKSKLRRESRESFRSHAPVALDAETEAWLAKLTPSWAELRRLGEPMGYGPYEPGYEPQQLQGLERELGFSLPPEIRAHYLIHAAVGSAWGNVGFAELESIQENCQILNQVAKKIRLASMPGTRRPRFGPDLIPLNYDAPAICIDLNPGKGGTRGQIIEVDFEDSVSRVLATNFGAFLRQGIIDLRIEASYAEEANGGQAPLPGNPRRS